MTTRQGRGTATLERRAVAASDSRADAYQRVTDQVIAMLEAGTVPWHKPWNAESGGMPRSLSTGKPYRGINPFLLQMSAITEEYSSPWWATYRQIKERGGQVRKGEHGTLITFWKQYTRRGSDEEDERTAYVLRTYNVFNTDQADGLVSPPVPGHISQSARIAACDDAVANYFATGPYLVHRGDRAFYMPSTDVVTMPERAAFESPETYYDVLFHEATHSTGHRTRLARPDLLEFHAFGDANYSREELVAEMGSAFLSGHTGISTATLLQNSANYIASWLQALKNDKKLVIRAAGQAQKASDLILGITHSD